MDKVKVLIGKWNIVLLFLFLSFLYVFPIIRGLILLPLDLLVSNYSPWNLAAEIFLKNAYMQDSIIQMFPWKHLVYQSFHQGIIPFWNPYQHMGMPFMASFKPMVFYPFNILYLLDEKIAWNMLLFLQIFFSLIFSYVLARDLKLEKLSSIIVSFAFSFNSLMVSMLEMGSEGHVLLWMPLFILLAKRYVDRHERRYLFFLGCSVATDIFAGQLQYTAYQFIMLLGFIAWYGYIRKEQFTHILAVYVSILLGIGMSVIQLIPGIELFSHSYRGIASSYRVFTNGLIHPYQLARLFSPDFFGNPVTRDLKIGYIETSGYFGIIPLFFCLYAMLFCWKDNFVKYFTVLFFFGIFSTLQGIGLLLYVLRIPIITSGSADRIFSIVLFSGAMLSGFGLSEFMKTKNRKRNMWTLFIFGSFFCGLILISFLTSNTFIPPRELFLQDIRFSLIIFGIFSLLTGMYFLLKKKFPYASIVFIISVLFITFFDLYRLGYRFLTFSNRRFFYPDTNVVKYIQNASRNSLSRSYGLVEPELDSFFSVYGVETYNPLYLLKSGLLLQTLQKIPQKEKLPVNKYYLTLHTPYIKSVLDFLGADYIVSGKDENPASTYFTPQAQKDLVLVYADSRHQVYKNTAAYPRFRLYYKARVAKDDAEALHLLSEGNLDLSKELIITAPFTYPLEQGIGTTRLISSTVNMQKFAITTDRPALFFISDTYFPGWTSTVNGMPTKIYQADYNFKAIYIPRGKSLVIFSYLPTHFRSALFISIASIVLLGVFCFSKIRFLRLS